MNPFADAGRAAEARGHRPRRNDEKPTCRNYRPNCHHVNPLLIIRPTHGLHLSTRIKCLLIFYSPSNSSWNFVPRRTHWPLVRSSGFTTRCADPLFVITPWNGLSASSRAQQPNRTVQGEYATKDLRISMRMAMLISKRMISRVSRGAFATQSLADAFPNELDPVRLQIPRTGRTRDGGTSPSSPSYSSSMPPSHHQVPPVV